MPDFSMCADSTCPSRSRCRRFAATPDDFQYYADFGATRGDRAACDDFWPLDESKAKE